MKDLKLFNLEEEYLNEKDSMSSPQISYTNDTTNVWIKTDLGKFTISGAHGDDVSFRFKIGMTWNDFYNSSYNDGELEVYYNNEVAYDSHYIRLSINEEQVYGDDLIINNHVYYTEEN